LRAAMGASGVSLASGGYSVYRMRGTCRGGGSSMHGMPGAGRVLCSSAQQHAAHPGRAAARVARTTCELQMWESRKAVAWPRCHLSLRPMTPGSGS
jgi:hypothetical protein